MQVSVERVSPVERRLTIVVPANQVEEAYTKQINQLAKTANIKGFRKGKAPIDFIKKRFGEDARKEALSEVIQQSLHEAIKNEKLRPISTPRVEPKVLTPNQPLEFIASFEVLPDIAKINFSLESIEKPVVVITDEDVTRVIEQLQKQATEWHIVDRAAQEKDRIVIDYHTIFEGKADEENKITSFPLELGSKAMVAGFEEGLYGIKAGEERTLHLAYPSDFSVQERAGKPVDFVIQVKQVFEALPPALDGDLIQRLGVASGKIEDLQEQIKASLSQERDRLVREKMKEQVFQKLLEQNPLEVPNSLVQREAGHIHDEIYPSHAHQKEHPHSEQEMTAFHEIAKKRVVLGLLISEYANQTNMKVDKERVLTRIKEIAVAYQHPQEVVQWLSSEERRSGIEAQVMEDQVMDKFLEGILVIEKTMTYPELKGIRI